MIQNINLFISDMIILFKWSWYTLQYDDVKVRKHHIGKNGMWKYKIICFEGLDYYNIKEIVLFDNTGN